LFEECNNNGIEYLLEKVDMIPIFNKLKSASIDDIHRTLHVSQYIIVEMNYVGGEYPDYDFDLETKIIGYLNENMELVKI
jgi:hypothetical protein